MYIAGVYAGADWLRKKKRKKNILELHCNWFGSGKGVLKPHVCLHAGSCCNHLYNGKIQFSA